MLARAIYVSGSPLSIVESPLWLDVFKRLRPSFNVAGRKLVSTTLLDKEYNSVKFAVEEELRGSNVLHLQCDGWSNIRNESIINFVITHPKPLFVDFVPTAENRHTGEYLGQQIEKIIEKYGSQKFYSCIGDNAANMQLGLRKGTAKFPHIEIIGCKAHTLNLLCQDLLALSSANKIFGQAKFIIKKIKKSHVLNSLFMQKQREKKIATALKIPPDTRWSYGLETLDCLIENKSVLMLMAIDTDFDDTHETGSDDTETLDLPGGVKKLILDEQFWQKVSNLCGILQPIVASLTKIESDDLVIHNAHEIMAKMFSSIQSMIQSAVVFNARDKKAAIECLEKRKNAIMVPILLAAAILNPCDFGSSLTSDELMNGMEFIFASARNVGLNVETLMVQLTNYRNKLDIWSKEFIWAGVSGVKPTAWWKAFFSHTDLGIMAEKILTTPITSAATERSFSTFGNVHTKKRNRLTTERAGKITFIAHNYKLMNPKRKAEGEPSAKRMRIANESESEYEYESETD